MVVPPKARDAELCRRPPSRRAARTPLVAPQFRRAAHSLVEAMEEPKYRLVDRALSIPTTPPLDWRPGQAPLELPIPVFKRLPARLKRPAQRPRDEVVSEEACAKRHRPMERQEQREIKRDRELEAYSRYMEKLRTEFPSHFADAPASRRKSRQ